MSLLNTPLVRGKLNIPNRLMLPPMATARSDADGAVTQALLDYYREKTQGGCIGLAVTEHCFVSPEGRAGKGQLSVSHDGVIPGFRALASVIKSSGSVALAQISHAGAAARPEGVDGGNTVNVNAASRQDVERIIRSFVAAAVRVKAAGFDGVQLHAAHGYLLNQFYSPLSNRRTDGFGGDVLGRVRVARDIVAGIREAAGDDFIIAVRLGACDYCPGGSSLEDAFAAAAALEAAGMDILDVSGGMNGMTRPGYNGLCYFSDTAAALRESVSVPVSVTGGVTLAETAEEILRLGQADLVGVGRAILKDSGWARRALGRG